MAEIDITRIAGNIGAMNALNSLQGINKQLAIHQTRLATGKRINSAADDPAGLSIASKMLARSEGLKVALSNIGDAKNLLAVAESGLGRINDILIQMRNKAAQAASDTMGQQERDIIKTQLLAFSKQIDDIVNQTKWNDTQLLNFTGDPMRFQAGAESGDAIYFDGITGIDAEGLGIATVVEATTATISSDLDSALDSVEGGKAVADGFSELEAGEYTVKLNLDTTGETGSEITTGTIQLLKGSEVVQIATEEFNYGDTQTVDLGVGLSVTFNTGLADGDYTATVTYTTAGYSIEADTASEYADYLNRVETAMNRINNEMSNLGSLIGRLTFKEDQVSAAQINVEAAYNRIMNANMAEEQVNASKFLILQQTATAMLAQANAAPQFLLSLFR